MEGAKRHRKFKPNNRYQHSYFSYCLKSCLRKVTWYYALYVLPGLGVGDKVHKWCKSINDSQLLSLQFGFSFSTFNQQPLWPPFLYGTRNVCDSVIALADFPSLNTTALLNISQMEIHGLPKDNIQLCRLETLFQRVP